MSSAEQSEISGFRVWLLAARPKTLAAGIVPILVAGAMAWGLERFSWLVFAVCAGCALGIQILSNFANDYFDFVKGADTGERLGPLRVTQAGLVSLSGMRRAMLVVTLFVTALGAYLVFVGGLPILVIGILSIIFAFLYTGGPFPLAYLGLGELFVFIFFGLVAVGGTYFLLSGEVLPYVLWVGAAVGAISTAILVVNNLRDIRTDKQTGKRTLAARFGVRFARLEYTLLLFAAAAVPFILVKFYHLPVTVMFASLYLLLSRSVLKTVWTSSEGGELNSALAKTGALLFAFGLLFSLGWLYGY